MTLIFDDPFIEDTNTDLDFHPPDIGNSWVRQWGTAGSTKHVVDAATDVLTQEGSANTGAIYSADATYDSPNYIVEYALAATRGSPAQAVIVRMVDIENFWCLFHGSTSSSGTLARKKVAGVWGSAVGFQTPIVGEIIKIEIIGNDLTAYVNDVVKYQNLGITDIPAAGPAGLGMGGGDEMFSAAHDPGGWQLEYFKITTLETGPTIGPKATLIGL